MNIAVKIITGSVFITVVMTFFIACSEDVAVSSNDDKNTSLEQSNLEFNTYEGLVAEVPCDASLDGMIAYVKSTDENYICGYDSVQTIWTWMDSLSNHKPSSAIDEISSLSSSSKKRTSSSSIDARQSSSSIDCLSSEIVSSSSSLFSIEEYLNPNISYGEITDERDGQVYKTVVIGEQTWMAQNLNFKTDKSYCLQDKKENCVKYGRLYTWGDAMDSAGTYSESGKDCGYKTKCTPLYYLGVRGLCPEGFHIPDVGELGELMDFVDENHLAANICDAQKLRSRKLWEGLDYATDDYGFSAIPSGNRDRKGAYWYGAASYWLSNPYDKFKAAYFDIASSLYQTEEVMDFAFSIRCVKDRFERGTFTDERDGQTYKTVKIGRQKWMVQNLNFAYLQPTETEDSSSYCYEDLPENCEKYGRLYLWSAAMDSVGLYSESGKGCGYMEICDSPDFVQGVCPNGWHLPTEDEFSILGKAVDGGPGISDEYLNYLSPFWKTTVYSPGFKDDQGYVKSDYRTGGLWSSTEIDNESVQAGDGWKWNALSVRCVENVSK